MNFSYPKSNRLKSKTIIDSLFTKGTSVSVFPLRLVFVKTENKNAPSLSMGVSVSKRNFKKAVDRNYFKRLLRETYRLNQHILREAIENKDANYSAMFFYQTKERLSFEEVNQKTILLFEKFKKSQLNQEG
jgi:ribonuclease P protein component